ncbi:MAG: hypothetical protein WBF81_00650 [Thermoplasmata archaeon]
MAEPRASPVLTILIALVVVVAGGGIFAYLYLENHKSPGAGPLTVQLGDNVTLNYTGIFASGPQQGRVFDTSVYSVALNNASWPKSLLYSSRGGQPSDYVPLNIYVGPSGSYTIGNLTFGTVVPGFWQGLIGVPGNRTTYVSVPANLGYPASLINASCYLTQPLVYSIPVVTALPPAQFATIFTNVTINPGTQVPDPTYGWPDLILSTNDSAIVYENLPSLGMTVNPNGWPVTVTNLTTTTITLQNQLIPNQAGRILGHTAGVGVCGSSTFIVSQVNLGAGTYVRDYGSASAGNREVYGQNLIFIVSVVDIYRP